MLGLSIPPGGPGIRPTWASSAKDLVTTALGTGRVWVTLGHGILNEIYWPTTGTPQTRDLGFIVASPNGWFEVKRINRYTVSTPAPSVPLPYVVHQGEDYQLILEILPDPLRDVVQISYQLVGEDLKLYVLLAPHLGNSGERNNARASKSCSPGGQAAPLPRQRPGFCDQAPATSAI
jgi:glucoamylase